MVRAMTFQLISSSIITCFACTCKMASRPFKSGNSTGMRRSKRPGRNKAASRLSGRFVAAKITTPEEPSNPSISLSSWFNVCSRSSLPFKPAPSRFLPMVSSSSINTIQGDFSLACLNKSRTRAAPRPTNISTNSLPAMEKNGTPASPATAFAKRVLPVPGGPTSKAPFGILAPTDLYLSGLCKKSTISSSASFASSWPATSSNVMPVCACTYTFAFDFPKLMASPPMRFESMRNNK